MGDRLIWNRVCDTNNSLEHFHLQFGALCGEQFDFAIIQLFLFLPVRLIRLHMTLPYVPHSLKQTKQKLLFVFYSRDKYRITVGLKFTF